MSNSDATLPTQIPNQADRNSPSFSFFKSTPGSLPKLVTVPLLKNQTPGIPYQHQLKSSSVPPVELKIKPPPLLITSTFAWRKAVTKLMIAVSIDSIVVKAFRNDLTKIQWADTDMFRICPKIL